MTLLVGILCTDGVVIGADSMLTSSWGNQPLAHHSGKKIWTDEEWIFAYAGNTDIGHSIKYFVESHFKQPIQPQNDNFQFVKRLANSLSVNLLQIDQGVTAGLLAYHRDNSFFCTILNTINRPFILDKDHFYQAMGSGQLGAEPFLIHLLDIFCDGKQPNVNIARFITTWVIEHVIATNAGGVAGPIRIATINYNESDKININELKEGQIDESRDWVTKIKFDLQKWRDKTFFSKTSEDTGNSLESIVKKSDK
ncbi:MAG: hypothetical protein QM523_01225 [Candidatus Pacebacteria bacterium]|nr:hypothetical protein [Candidatus Paceibacterota bacterium]